MSQKDCVFLFQQNLLQHIVYCVATLFAEGLEGSPAIQEVDVVAIAGDSWDLRSHQHRLGVQNVSSIEWLLDHSMYLFGFLHLQFMEIKMDGTHGTCM